MMSAGRGVAVEKKVGGRGRREDGERRREREGRRLIRWSIMVRVEEVVMG